MNLHKELEHYFGYKEFRAGQEEIISDLLHQNNVFAMLPTGTGKSICYQLPALLLPNLTVIVSPLLSLMEDQVQQLKSIGIKSVAALNSFLSYPEKKNILEQLSTYKIIYVSPEILQNQAVIASIKSVKVSLFVVDEAHCISQWGHEFRTDYLRLDKVYKALESPPCLAITATATKEVQHDIINQLGLASFRQHIYSVDRPNIALKVVETKTVEEKKREIIELATDLQGPGLLYFSSRKWTEMFASELKKAGIHKVSYYHGGMENEDRILIQQQFIEGELDVICCTSAFGMGINKANVRYVIHFHYPPQIESYLQEIGRAGRDGENSIAILFRSQEDALLTKQLNESDLPNEFEIRETINYLKILEQSNIYLDHEGEQRLLFELGLPETMWRFLKYHFVNMNVIRNDQIIIKDISKIMMDVMNIVQDRINVKRKKLSEMELWLSTKTCRRVAYLTYFNESSNDRPKYCCDICQFEMEIFLKKENQQQEENLELTWKRRLQLIFHQTEEVD